MIGKDKPRNKKVPISNSSTVSSRYGTQSFRFLRQIFGGKLFPGISQKPREGPEKSSEIWKKKRGRKRPIRMKFKENKRTQNKNPLFQKQNPPFKKIEQELNCQK
ncbi:hypothetical protein CEXT_541631 [Caerostris extrusa]|uniref:Uncharacterized protein n=1 Tax=Caerostris extrusa TaxID=172846 RepID=A0AAV4R0G3_CAEEX|nr:hypothetical protein CEXT_541631 [Caerostris extrusa]